jgi:hypothetical protein
MYVQRSDPAWQFSPQPWARSEYSLLITTTSSPTLITRSFGSTGCSASPDDHSSPPCPPTGRLTNPCPPPLPSLVGWITDSPWIGLWEGIHYRNPGGLIVSNTSRHVHIWYIRVEQGFTHLRGRTYQPSKKLEEWNWGKFEWLDDLERNHHTLARVPSLNPRAVMLAVHSLTNSSPTVSTLYSTSIETPEKNPSFTLPSFTWQPITSLSTIQLLRNDQELITWSILRGVHHSTQTDQADLWIIPLSPPRFFIFFFLFLLPASYSKYPVDPSQNSMH